ncbi:hypothetical protein BJ508DRAFT_325693 [Ascobolus immersus RN42]|uniref:Uncharacterized protein n=1 Tax=Ascobolus immersus RN42 TaxID=1160509 RepID=A0A3N4IBY0_ASCIM|nr:hypothetical protein BJ508DRAFT_325693 [Ascobolus immersus RN42]
MPAPASTTSTPPSEIILEQLKLRQLILALQRNLSEAEAKIRARTAMIEEMKTNLHGLRERRDMIERYSLPGHGNVESWGAEVERLSGQLGAAEEENWRYGVEVEEKRVLMARLVKQCEDLFERFANLDT